MSCHKLWMKTGTAKRPKFIPVHDVHMQLLVTDEYYETLIHFHAITGCDTVSYFSNHSKNTAWNMFLTYNHLLKEVGQEELTPSKVRDANRLYARCTKC